MVESVEDAGTGEIGKSEDGDDAEMPLAQHRLDPTGKRLVD